MPPCVSSVIAPTCPPTDESMKTQSTTNSSQKIIRAPGKLFGRIAQACDRCRVKKSRCDGKVPHCSSCVAVGIKCVVSDKLSRRSFPKGYTENLEEYVRQLEAENTKLQGLVHLRDEQLASYIEKEHRNSVMNTVTENREVKREDGNSLSGVQHHSDHFDSNTLDSATVRNHKDLPSSSLPNSNTHKHDDEFCDFCAGSPVAHQRLVSLAGCGIPSPTNLIDARKDVASIDSYIQTKLFHIHESPSPGSFAVASAFEKMSKPHQENEVSKKQLLTTLVATALPRSTEETLFVPTLLAKLCQVHGFKSNVARLTANAIALLKEFVPQKIINDNNIESCDKEVLDLVMDVDGMKLTSESAFKFLSGLQLPSKNEMDHLLNVYFDNWGTTLPILDETVFRTNFIRYCEVSEKGYLSQKLVHSFELWEKLGALLVLTTTLALLSLKPRFINSASGVNLAAYQNRLNRFNNLICEFIKPNCILTKYCSIESLKILTLAFQYCLAIGDIARSYDLRGRVVLMAQQLRMHRCPAAVLGISNEQSDMDSQRFMQAERRISFWCVYCLDVYSSLVLGLPRLLKDYEIECSMPFSEGNSEKSSNSKSVLIINNTRLTIFGKVSPSALSFMQYCKVLGGIIDSVFSRSKERDERDKASFQDGILDCWRRDLPKALKFNIDVNGFSLKTGSSSQVTDWSCFSHGQILAIYLYYHAKILIYLPILSKYGNHCNVGLSEKDQLEQNQPNRRDLVTSISMIQQSCMLILELLASLSVSLQFLPIPLNISREQARFSLLVAKGSMDYIKGGVLHQNLKNVLSETLRILSFETKCEMPGALSNHCAKLVDLSIDRILNSRSEPFRNVTHHENTQQRPNPIKDPKPSDETEIASTVKWCEDLDVDSQTSKYHFIKTEEQSLVSKIPDAMNNPLDVQVKNPTVDVINEPWHPNITNLLNSLTSFSENWFGFNNQEHDCFYSNPLDLELNNELMVNEFIADGSLGLIPFIGAETRELDEDNLSDCYGEDGAFSY